MELVDLLFRHYGIEIRDEHVEEMLEKKEESVRLKLKEIFEPSEEVEYVEDGRLANNVDLLA